jgi:hypothetical protein
MSQRAYPEPSECLFRVETFLFDIIIFFSHVIHARMGRFKGDVGLAGGLFSEFVEVVSASDK